MWKHLQAAVSIDVAGSCSQWFPKNGASGTLKSFGPLGSECSPAGITKGWHLKGLPLKLKKKLQNEGVFFHLGWTKFMWKNCWFWQSHVKNTGFLLLAQSRRLKTEVLKKIWSTFASGEFSPIKSRSYAGDTKTSSFCKGAPALPSSICFSCDFHSLSTVAEGQDRWTC